MHISALRRELEGVYKYAPLVIEITELHRKAHYYSTRKFIVPICEAIENIPEILVKEALEKFKAKNPPPHPNYFKLTCIGLMNQNGNFSKFAQTI